MTGPAAPAARVPVDGVRETRELGTAFNEMSEALERRERHQRVVATLGGHRQERRRDVCVPDHAHRIGRGSADVCVRILQHLQQPIQRAWRADSRQRVHHQRAHGVVAVPGADADQRDPHGSGLRSRSSFRKWVAHEMQGS